MAAFIIDGVDGKIVIHDALKDMEDNIDTEIFLHAKFIEPSSGSSRFLDIHGDFFYFDCKRALRKQLKKGDCYVICAMASSKHRAIISSVVYNTTSKFLLDRNVLTDPIV